MQKTESDYDLSFAQNLNTWMFFSLTMAFVAEILHALLVGRPAFLNFFPGDNWLDWPNMLGAFIGIPVCVLLIGGSLSFIPLLFRVVAVFLGFCLSGYQIIFNSESGIYSPSAVLCITLAPLGLLAFICIVGSRDGQLNVRWKFWRIAILLNSLTLSTHAALQINRIIFPATWDYFVYRIDGAFGSVVKYLAMLNKHGSPMLQASTSTLYAILIFCLYAIIALAIRKKAIIRLHVWRAVIVPFFLAWILYAFLPLSGPAYAFFDGSFPDSIPLPLDVVASQVIVPPAYRNGMPSMHLTGAVLIWMLAVGLRERLAMIFSSLLVLGTVWSTLASGEHYVLDLIVAVPFSAFIGSILISPDCFRANIKSQYVLVISGLTFVTWLLLLRIFPIWLSENWLFVKIFSIWSLVCSAIVFNIFWRGQSIQYNERNEFINNNKNAVIATPKWVIAVFCLSGFAGLVYEVVFAKALAVTFGSTALASYTVLATYMGGMALGAWFGGYWADKVKRPLISYAACEALIGLYAVVTPVIFQFIQYFYVSVSLDLPPSSGWLTAFRLGLGVVSLGIPTVLMGATLPLMFAHLRSLGISSERAIAPLYGANVVGAALGSIISAYIILPAIGRNGGTYLAAVLSLTIALYVFDLSKKIPWVRFEEETDKRSESQSGNIRLGRWHGPVALWILFLGGAVTLGLEVNSMHILAVVAGNSVYAFGLMLAAFLGGLGSGSSVGAYLMRRMKRMELIALAQCGVAAAIGVTAHIWDELPSYFSSFSLYPVSLSFSARETIRALVCAVAMLPPAFFVGMSYPVAMSVASDWLAPKGGARGIGVASGVNTLGNILGVLVIGFWLLPTLGSRNTSLVLSGAALSLGVLAIVVFICTSTKWNGLIYRLAPVGGVLGILAIFPSDWNYNDLSTGGNVYFAAQNWGEVIAHAESVEGGLTTVARNSDGIYTLLTNGKFQGNNSVGGEMVAQESFALFPLLHTSERNAALVIGYGTGMTARVLHDSMFKEVNIAETSKDIVSLANMYFDNINRLVTNNDNVNIDFTDGRNFLLTQSKKFSLISIEITSIWFAGAANLYNKDFYALAKTRLEEKGVLQQWVQLHHISPIDLAYVISSVRAEFKYVWLYVRGGQGVIVASNSSESLVYPGQQLVASHEGARNSDHQPDKLKASIVLGPKGVDNFISSFDPSMSALVSTDVNLYLEHSTPKGNAMGDVVRKNIDFLSQFEK